jgi:hypothetical protein
MSYFVKPERQGLDKEDDGLSPAQDKRETIKKDVLPLLPLLNRRLRTIVIEAVWQRALVKRARAFFHRKLPRLSLDEEADSSAIVQAAQSGAKRPRASSPQPSGPPQKQIRVPGRTGRKNQNRAGAQKKAADAETLRTRLSSASADSQDVSKAATWWTDISCGRCESLPAEQRCVRMVQVDRNPDADKYIDYALTHAPEDDRLEPKPPPVGAHLVSALLG